MPNLATWLRRSDERWFRPIFARFPQVQIWNAQRRAVPLEQMDALLLTGGPDIAPEYLRQENVDCSLIKTPNPARDLWELKAVEDAVARGLAVLGICKGLQVMNVALGGTLRLDIPNHDRPEMRDHDVQPLRTARAARHRFAQVNSSHHQAVDRIADGFEVEAWSAADDVIEQIRLRDHPFALGVQYHPERGAIYDALFDSFFERIISRANAVNPLRPA